MLELDYLPGRTLTTAEGRQYLFCSGTSYLGISRNAEFAALLAEGLARYGSNYGSSRHSSLRLRVYEEVEAYLAAYLGAEAAITVSSGYLAGQMAVKALARAGRFEYAPGTHPAAWLLEHSAVAASSLPYAAWAAQLLERLHREPAAPVVIVSNSLDPLRVERYDFRWLQQLPTDRPVTVLLDDSHGFGVIGPDGSGISAEVRVPAGVRLVVVSSLGKACGIPGGAVWADAAFVNELRRSAFFGASSPVVPAYLYAFLQAAELYRAARRQLTANVMDFAAATANLGLFRFMRELPVFYTPQDSLCEFLEAQGVLISSFHYPTPADARITRVVLSALHTPADVKQLAALCVEFARPPHPLD